MITKIKRKISNLLKNFRFFLWKYTPINTKKIKFLRFFNNICDKEYDLQMRELHE